MRHAKSSFPDGVADHDRPLGERGRRDAPAIGERLSTLGWAPELVLCSSARRTRQTWGLIGPTLGDPPVRVLPELYLASPAQILACLRAHGRGTTAVVCHNPGVGELVYEATGHVETITTCNAALLVSDEDSWAEAVDSGWELEDLLRPRPPRE